MGSRGDRRPIVPGVIFNQYGKLGKVVELVALRTVFINSKRIVGAARHRYALAMPATVFASMEGAAEFAVVVE